MIQRLNYVISESTNPCVNLAMEERLLDTVQDGEATVYLWQNERTVVIGKNQNACAECNLTALREDGGRLVRRLSGGGAVYHDLGNLNFTFLSKAADEKTGRNLEIIAGALRSFGLEPQKSGRNASPERAKVFRKCFLHKERQRLPSRYVDAECGCRTD